MVPGARCEERVCRGCGAVRFESGQEPDAEHYGAGVAYVGPSAGAGAKGRAVMAMDGLTRRAVLKSLSMSVAAGSVLRVIPVEAAEHAHHEIDQEKAQAPYTPKYFDAHGYKTLQ